jgi:hypothetical protein
MEERKLYKVLMGKPKGNRPHGRPRKAGIRMDLRENSWGAWIGFDWLRTGTDGELLCMQ